MKTRPPRQERRLQRSRATAAFELMAVVSIAGLVTSSLIPLLGSSAEIDNLRRTMMITKQEDYLFAMESAALGIPSDALPSQILAESEQAEEDAS